MLEEVEDAAGAQDPGDLGECPVDVGDGAQRPGGEDVVDAGAIEGQVLAVETDVVDRHGALGDTAGSELAAHGRRVDGAHARDSRRVVGDVEATAEADLQHLPV